MTGITPAGDPRFGIAKELLVRLVRSVLREETEARETEARLWRLPESAAYYTFNATSHADRQALAPLVHELRAEVAGIIEALVEREPARTRLGHRLHEAACRCELRPWRSDDTAAYSALLDNERVWAMLPEPYPGPITRSMAADLIALSNGAPERHMVRAAIWRREPVGQVRLEFDRSPARQDSAEVSYWLGERFWGRGLATDLVALMTAEGFAAHPGVRRVFARVVHGHDASVGVLEKAGYHVEEPCASTVVKHGRTLGVQTLSVWRSQYVTNAAVLRAPRRVPLLFPISVSPTCLTELSEVVSMLAAVG